MAAQERRQSKTPTGIPVDASGGATVDPTKNVLDLVSAAVLRVDDLAEVRGQLVDEKIKRMEREWIHLDKIAELRELHNREMRDSESRRVDANRATDLAAVGTAATQALAQINTVAATATVTAETLRTQVATTATAAENRLGLFSGDVNKRLSALELSSSEGKGKQTVTDPAYEKLVEQMERIAQNQLLGTGKRQGIELSWGVVLALVAILAALYSGVLTRLAPTRDASPQVIYVPAPPNTMLPTTPPATPPR
jgi:hypothetical protein